MRDEINTISWLKRKLKNDDNSQQEKEIENRIFEC